MIPLLQVISETKDRLSAANHVSLFLEFDGTLVPISPDPTVPRLDPHTTQTLELIAGQDSVWTTVISGRAVEDLYTRIRVNGLVYAGNHGLEIFGRNLRFVNPAASCQRRLLDRLCDELAVQLRPISGAKVEYKGLTASVHHRQATEHDSSRIEEIVRAAVDRTGGSFELNPGNKVLEILPQTGWHKEAAVRWINSRLGDPETLSIYLGDDSCYDGALSALPNSVTIRVGETPTTRAKCRLPGPTGVHEFLLWLAIQQAVRPTQVMK